MTEISTRERANEFAKAIIFLVKDVQSQEREYVLTGQLLRAGTSIGANLSEAQYAQSGADFVSKLEIALKECYESEYWLELMFETGYIAEAKYKKLVADCGTIRRMLISACKTSKAEIE